jgi:hypothetical protein
VLEQVTGRPIQSARERVLKYINYRFRRRAQILASLWRAIEMLLEPRLAMKHDPKQ